MALDPDEKAKLGLNLASDARKLEIGLLWSRSLYFWGILTVVLAFYGAAIDREHWAYGCLAACFGFLCSVCWTLANRSGKHWQEVWERQTNYWSSQLFEISLFALHPDVDVPERWFWGAKHFSPSKLQTIVSDLTTLLWAILSIGPIIQESRGWFRALYCVMFLVTVALAVGVVFWSRPGDPLTFGQMRAVVKLRVGQMRRWAARTPRQDDF